jgi:hypothetical protein
MMGFQRERIDEINEQQGAGPSDSLKRLGARKCAPAEAAVGTDEAPAQPALGVAWAVPTIPRRSGHLRRLPAALYALLLLSFLLPFMTVSCSAGGVSSKQTYTGVDLLRDKPVHDLERMMRSSNPGGSGGSSSEGGTFTLKYQLMLTLLMAFIGLLAALGTSRASRLASIVAGAVALGGLIWFNGLWGATLAQWEGVENSYRLGFWSAVACAILAPLGSALVYLRERRPDG